MLLEIFSVVSLKIHNIHSIFHKIIILCGNILRINFQWNIFPIFQILIHEENCLSQLII